MNKTLTDGSSPAIIHSEKGNGFHEFFKEQTKKIEFSQNRVKIVSTPSIVSNLFRQNYDSIAWRVGGKQLTKVI